MTKRKFSEEIQRVYGHINMLQHLRILDVDVKDALKYAEAKNSILLAINGVALNVLGGTAFSHIELIKNSPILSIIVALGIVFLLLSIIINLLSFMPVLKYHWLNQEEEYYNDKDNPLYIGDIARYQRNNYIKRIFTIFGEDPEEVNEAEKKYIDQIQINSVLQCFVMHLICSDYTNIILGYLPHGIKTKK